MRLEYLLWALSVLMAGAVFYRVADDRQGLPIIIFYCAIFVFLVAITSRVRRPKRAILACLLSCVLSCAICVYLNAGPELKDLEKNGNDIIECLEQYWRTHNHYPSSLSDAHCGVPWNRFAEWIYAPGKNELSFELSVGVYENDGFVLSWNGGQWKWDL